MPLSQKHQAFLDHGHGLSTSSWSAWFTAYQYADEIKSPLLALIDRGCNYAEKQRHVPEKYLRAAERLYKEAITTTL